MGKFEPVKQLVKSTSYDKVVKCPISFFTNLILIWFCSDEDEDNLCTVVISLMQKGRRELRDEGLDMLTIGNDLKRFTISDQVHKQLLKHVVAEINSKHVLNMSAKAWPVQIIKCQLKLSLLGMDLYRCQQHLCR